MVKLKNFLRAFVLDSVDAVTGVKVLSSAQGERQFPL